MALEEFWTTFKTKFVLLGVPFTPKPPSPLRKTLEGWVGHVRQWWMAKKKLELWNTTWPGDLLHTWTHTLGHVWEKPFLLHSFLSQQKTTLITHNWEPCQPNHAGHTMADSSSNTKELWNTTWPEDSLHTRTHTSSCAGEKRFLLHSFLGPNVVCTSIPGGL